MDKTNKMKTELEIKSFGELTEFQIKDYYRIRYSEFVHSNFGGRKPSLENHLKWFQSAANSESYRGFGALIGEELIGGFSLKNISTLNECAEFDIFLDREATGKGFAKVMMAKLLKTGFEEIELHRIYAFLLEENRKALSVYLKLGFKHEGVLRQNVKKQNRFHNSIAISILKHEYEGDNKSA